MVKFVFSKKATKFDKTFSVDLTITTYHGLWTPNEGINQRNLKSLFDTIITLILMITKGP